MIVGLHMNKRMNPGLIVAVLVCGLLVCTSVWAAAANDEAGMMQLLQSPQTPPAQKDEICQQLRMTGSAKCVPAVAPLLADESLSQSARLVLEAMAGPEAGQALREALAKTSGQTKAGIVDSLGARRERESLAVMVPLLNDADAMVASAAALALGRIGGAQAVEALHGARIGATPALQTTIVDALLLCADGLLAGGDSRGAAGIYKEMFDAARLAHQRAAAFRGMVLAGGDEAAGVVVKGLEPADPAVLKVAVQLVRELKGEAATAAFAAALGKAPPQVQVSMLESLLQRGDKAAASAVVSLVKAESPEVRLAALTAMRTLGDASHALFLAEVAARGTPADQEAARQSLALLRDSKVCDTLLAGLAKANPAVQGEIVRALGQRQESSAVPSLLKMATGPDQGIRLLALRSLSMLATAEHHKALAQLLVAAGNDEERDAAERALAAACLRGDKPAASAPGLIESMKAVPAGAQSAVTRAALLRVIGRLGGAESLAALRAGLQDTDATIQDAALRTMAEYAGMEAADDLLKLGGDPKRPVAQHVQGLRGYWRLVGLAGQSPAAERLRMCESGLAASERAEEKRLGLAELAKVADPAALKLARSMCEVEAIRAEADTACVRIATALLARNPEEARAELRRVAGSSKSEALQAEARKALEGADQFAGYITVWSVAGPYRQAGKQFNELFDIAFPPEKADAKVQWKRLAPPADPSLFWQADLLPVADGDQCVVYVKSRVFCPKVQKARLDIGSDDGVKIWVNGALVHSHNIARPIKAGEDSAEAALKEGWNDFLVKVTQNNLGFAVCIRIRNSDGAPISGLRFE
ncbi:MAG: HEAT repeat domain-containing protein [Tepidisphaerales bacterium]